jgi:hypothetical protein
MAKNTNQEIADAIEAFVKYDFCGKEASRQTGIKYSRINNAVSNHYLYKKGENVIVKQSKV